MTEPVPDPVGGAAGMEAVPPPVAGAVASSGPSVSDGDTTSQGNEDAARPVFGRPSPAAGTEPVLRAAGDGGTASWRAEGASVAWCTLRAASVAGVRHRLAGQGSDDAFAWAHDGPRLAVAVADGVGSVAGSAGAAHRAVTGAVAAALAAATPGAGPAAGSTAGTGATAETALQSAIEAANRAAEGGGATTLVVALVQPAADGALDVALARVGDSTARLVAPGANGEEIFAAPDADRSDTATAALPAASPVVETVVTTLPAEAVLVLVTDGVGDPWRDGPSTVGPGLAATLLERPSPPELLRVIDFSRRGCHDDRTLVALWARPPATDAGAADGG